MDSLNLTAKKNGLLYGTALKSQYLKDSAYKQLVSQHCGIIVPEYGTDFDTLQPQQGKFDYTEADAVYAFADSIGASKRLHTLVWENALPDWFNSYVNQNNALTVMTNHIQTVMNRYKGKMHSVTVCNEVLEQSDNQPGGLKNTPWYKFIGADYIAKAFTIAHNTDPSTKLYISDWSLENTDSDYDVTKQQNMLALLTKLVKQGVPIHGLALESHIDWNGTYDITKNGKFYKTVCDLGLDLMISELDCEDQGSTGDLNSRDKQVADKYQEFLNAAMPYVNTAVMNWEMNDSLSWLILDQGKQWARSDGKPIRPLPFDDNNQPKQAATVIANSFALSKGNQSTPVITAPNNPTTVTPVKSNHTHQVFNVSTDKENITITVDVTSK